MTDDNTTYSWPQPSWNYTVPPEISAIEQDTLRAEFAQDKENLEARILKFKNEIAFLNTESKKGQAKFEGYKEAVESLFVILVQELSRNSE